MQDIISGLYHTAMKQLTINTINNCLLYRTMQTVINRHASKPSEDKSGTDKPQHLCYSNYTYRVWQPPSTPVRGCVLPLLLMAGLPFTIHPEQQWQKTGVLRPKIKSEFSCQFNSGPSDSHLFTQVMLYGLYLGMKMGIVENSTRSRVGGGSETDRVATI